MLNAEDTLAPMDLVTENRLARRAAIMKTARLMIAERGFNALTIRDLAEACRVSVPTLYNQFGGKDQLLAAAIEDHFTADPGQLENITGLTGLDRINAILDFIAMQFLESPAFHRRLLEAFGSLESTASVQKKITADLAQEIEGELTGMQARGEVTPWVNCRTLSGQVTAAFIGATVIWGSGDIQDHQLSPAIAYGTGLVMLGIVHDELRPQIEHRLVHAQSTLEQGGEALIDRSQHV
ncbi:MAG: AcrR family transcriptional regulator [Candidatus Azotimanducaceae bacterium]|jgi:AcrR family transcriptional regulator